MEDIADSIVTTAKKRYNQARDFWSQSRDLSRQDILFSYGDTYNGNQYLGREGDREQRERNGWLTINIVEPACKKIVNSIRMNRPQAKVSPGDSNGSEEAAQLVEKWSRAVKSKSNADDATDCAVEMKSVAVKVTLSSILITSMSIHLNSKCLLSRFVTHSACI
jgi:hypothetical protein